MSLRKRLTFFALVLFEFVHSVERGSTGNQLMAELGFVVGLLDLVVVILSLVYGIVLAFGCSWIYSNSRTHRSRTCWRML